MSVAPSINEADPAAISVRKIAPDTAGLESAVPVVFFSLPHLAILLVPLLTVSLQVVQVIGIGMSAHEQGGG
jgi:hypothetical protein